MKSPLPEIPAQLRADVDFGYVTALPDVRKRLAVFYEYWRESVRHRTFTLLFREAGVFKPGWEPEGAWPEFFQMLGRKPEIFPTDVLMLLAGCDGFPERPFSESGMKEIAPDWRMAMNGITDWPWESLIAMRDDLTARGRSEIDFYTKAQPPCRTLNALSIPWNYTNDELTAMFRQSLTKLRPREFPEPKKAGRRGRSAGAGSVDVLNQLAVFRLAKAGFDFNTGGKLTLFTSGKGWKKAIIAAAKRIHNLSSHPLFG